MKLHFWLSTVSIATLALASTALAQDKPADPQDKKADATKDEKPESAKLNQISVGYTWYRLDPHINQYANPAEAFSILDARILKPLSEKSPYGFVEYKGGIGQDHVVEGLIALNHGRTIVRGSQSEYTFFGPSPFPVNQSAQNDVVWTVDQRLNPSMGMFLNYRYTDRSLSYVAPRADERTRTSTVAAGLGGRAFGGNVGVTFSDRKVLDVAQLTPDSDQRRVDVSYNRDFGPRLSLEGTASETAIQQVALQNSKIQAYTFGGVYDLGPSTNIQFNLRRQNLDLKNVLNAYVQKRLETSARLVHRFDKWGFQFGYRHMESERLRADQTFVDVPTTDAYDTRLTGPVGSARLTLKGAWEDVRNGAVMQTDDPRQLYWNKRINLQGKLDWGGETMSGYLAYTYRLTQNRDRGVEVGWHNIVLGTSYVFNPALSGYAEYAVDNFRVIGSDSGTSLETFFPNSRSAGAGLTWAKSPTLTATAAMNYFDNGDAGGWQLTLSLRKQLAAHRDLEFVVAPWRRDDNLYGVSDYRTTFLSVRFTERF